MSRIFSNSHCRKDHLGLALEKYGQGTIVSIAVAFFSDERLVRYLLDRGCTVELVVRLGFPTSARALERVIGRTGLQIRYYTSTKFHPKLYIFGDKAAFIGSSNLTYPGLFSNKELNVLVAAEDPSFGEVVGVFYEYWDEALVLTPETLDKYATIVSFLEKTSFEVESRIYKEIGLVGDKPFGQPGRIPKLDLQETCAADFLQSYQVFREERS